MALPGLSIPGLGFHRGRNGWEGSGASLDSENFGLPRRDSRIGMLAMKRRDALSLGFLAMLPVAACRKKTVAPPVVMGPAPEIPTPIAAKEGQDLVPVRVDPHSVIRTTTGLRPFRSKGFVVRREDHDGKMLIHNYGHGGGGMTLSWGSAHLAVQLAGNVAGKSCAVIGGGVMGLSTARLLQLAGARVTIHTGALPPDTTSNASGAQWWPFSVFDNSQRTSEFGAQYLEAARFSFHYFQRLVGERWGVRWVPNYYLSDGPPENGWISGPGGVLHDMQIDFRDFGPGEHVFSDGYARRFHTMMISPGTYLATLLQDVQIAGGEVAIRNFENASEIFQLPEQVIFNCTGLGAGELFADPELIPIKGQLSFLMPQQDVNYNLIGGDLYMFPRSDGIALGGTYAKNQWDTAVDIVARDRIVAAHQRLFDGMRQRQEIAANAR